MTESSGLSDDKMIVDWVSFTLPFEDGLSIVQWLFGQTEERPVGIRGYSHSASIVGSGVVGWSPQRPEQGVHVQLPSTALSNLRDVDRAFEDIKGFLMALLQLAAKIRRLDVAFDDRTGKLSLAEIERCVQDGRVVTRWRKVDQLRRIMGGEGQTMYFGDRSSQSFLRIYDKRAERVEKREDDPGHWIRVEMEFKDDKSHRVVERYVEAGVPFVAGILRGLVEFKGECGDPNKSRWPAADWWLEFLDWAEKTKVSMPREASTIVKTKRWLERQVAPGLALVVVADGGAVDFVHELLHSGERGLKPYQRALANAC